MGFSYTNNPNTSKEDYIAQNILRGWSTAAGSVATLDKSVVGNVVYVLHETRVEGESARRWIGVYRLEKSQGCWGHKDMDETWGTYYYDCPRRILDAAGPTNNETARQWRQDCRSHARRKAARRRLKPEPKAPLVGVARAAGMEIVKVLDPSRFGVKRGIVAKTADGEILRFRKSSFRREVFA